MAELKDIPLGSHKLEKIRIIPSELVKYSLTDSLTSSPFCPGGPGFPWKKSERNFHQNENRSTSFGSIQWEGGKEGWSSPTLFFINFRTTLPVWNSGVSLATKMPVFYFKISPFAAHSGSLLAARNSRVQGVENYSLFFFILTENWPG